jgi:3-dehydroquinate dehydratase type I
MEIGSLLNSQSGWDRGVPRRRSPILGTQSAPGTPLPRVAKAGRRESPPRRHSRASLLDVRQEANRRPLAKSRMSEPKAGVAESAAARPLRSFAPDASLVLVGIRGCGKRSLGFIAATALGRRFITEDHYFQEATGLSRQDYLRHHGSQEFHKRDVEISRRMLDENRTKCVIECGLGSLTTGVQGHLREYSMTNPVVYLVRDMAEISRFLRLEERAARLLENGDPTHRNCSNFEFYNLEDHTTQDKATEAVLDRRSPTYSFKLKDVKEDFTYFVRVITGASAYRSSYDSPFSLLEMPVDLRLFTHAVFLRFSELEEGGVELNQLESGGDAIELCIDRWTPGSLKTISRYVALIRRKIGIPIILSADRKSIANDETYVGILEHGFRLGAEFIIVDLTLNDAKIARLIANKGYTRVIGHWIDLGATSGSWDDEKWFVRFERAEMLGCDIVRLLKEATTRDDNETVRQFTEAIKSRNGMSPPLIAYNVGALGRTSQLFNPILTAVTHAAIPRITTLTPEAPLITSRDAVQALFQSFVLDPLHFYILGANVSYSLSPAMHNAAYHYLGMNHDYRTQNMSSLSELDALSQDPHFGGASIVQPWKVIIVDQLASKSRHAEAIGAVNTLLPLRAQADGTIFSLQHQASQRNRAGRVAAWYGDNTDWIGIMVCLNRNLSPRNVIRPLKTTGLVIGAGGMARAAIYAMLRLGCRKIFVHNRTVGNAHMVAQHFNSWASSSSNTNGGGQPGEQVVSVLHSRHDPWPANFAQPTLIVSCVPTHSINNQPPANFEMPEQWLQSPSGGVVLDMAYNPLITPLLKQMGKFRQSTGVPWVIVDGLEALPEQAIAQFELMTGRKAPRGVMRGEVLKSIRDGEREIGPS